MAARKDRLASLELESARQAEQKDADEAELWRGLLVGMQDNTLPPQAWEIVARTATRQLADGVPLHPWLETTLLNSEHVPQTLKRELRRL